MDGTLLATAHADGGAATYEQHIRVGSHTLSADEPAALGGADAGPTPYQLLLASLAACTSITLRMYADRKGWDLGPIHVDLVMARDHDVEKIERTILVSAALTAEQRTRLAEIAEKTPVTKTLRRGTEITTTLR
ncbi:MAG TPA: OsmC family protein [Kofleriaceae bacterium]|jgi:putative redox protein